MMDVNYEYRIPPAPGNGILIIRFDASGSKESDQIGKNQWTVTRIFEPCHGLGHGAKNGPIHRLRPAKPSHASPGEWPRDQSGGSVEGKGGESASVDSLRDALGKSGAGVEAGAGPVSRTIRNPA